MDKFKYVLTVLALLLLCSFAVADTCIDYEVTCFQQFQSCSDRCNSVIDMEPCTNMGTDCANNAMNRADKLSSCLAQCSREYMSCKTQTYMKCD